MIESKITTLELTYPNDIDRVVRVYVPAHEDGETFPVVYMTDGQNCFDMTDGIYGCWNTHKAVDEEIADCGQGAIIVAIHTDDPKKQNPLKRTGDLTPSSIGEIIAPDEMKMLIDPLGDVFDSFIVNTVMPYVEANFPVKKGRNNTAFCGSSMGGLMSFFTSVSHPDKCCAAGVFSPALMMFSPEVIGNWIRKNLTDPMPYLYFYTGAGDELENVIYHVTEDVYAVLTECYPLDKLNEVILLENKHHESSWEPIFKDFLHTFLTRREEF